MFLAFRPYYFSFFKKVPMARALHGLPCQLLVTRRNCVSSKSGSGTGCLDGGRDIGPVLRGRSERTKRPKRRNSPPCQEQGTAGVSGTSQQDAHFRHGKNRGHRRTERNRQGSPDRRRTSGSGERSPRRRQEVAL